MTPADFWPTLATWLVGPFVPLLGVTLAWRTLTRFLRA